MQIKIVKIMLYMYIFFVLQLLSNWKHQEQIVLLVYWNIQETITSHKDVLLNIYIPNEDFMVERSTNNGIIFTRQRCQNMIWFIW